MNMLNGYCRHFGGHVWQSRRCHIKKGKGAGNKCYSRDSGCEYAEPWVPKFLNELRKVTQPGQKQSLLKYILGPYAGPPTDFYQEIKYLYWAGPLAPKGGISSCSHCYASHPAMLNLGLVDEEWILDTPTDLTGIATAALARSLKTIICLLLTTALLGDLVNDDISKARQMNSRRQRREQLIMA